MQEKKTFPSINLNRKEGVSFIDNLFNWALTYGRFLIILTELIALSAFLYRFSLDSQLSDLHDQITQKQAVVNLLKNSEDTYRNLQARLSEISVLGDQAATKTKIMQGVISFAPYGFYFDAITESSNSISISAHVASAQALSIFINKLKNYQYINSVSLTSIDNKTDRSSIVVGISAELKKNPALTSYETK